MIYSSLSPSHLYYFCSFLQHLFINFSLTVHAAFLLSVTISHDSFPVTSYIWKNPKVREQKYFARLSKFKSISCHSRPLLFSFSLFYYKQFWETRNTISGLVWTTRRDLWIKVKVAMWVLGAVFSNLLYAIQSIKTFQNVLSQSWLLSPLGLLLAEVCNTWPEIPSNNFTDSSFSSEFFLFLGHPEFLKFCPGQMVAHKSGLFSL